MDYKSLPEVRDMRNLTIPQLKNEAERLAVDDQITSSMRKDDIIETLAPYRNKKKYREQRSKKFCQERGLKIRKDLNSTKRRKLQRILDGVATHKDEYGRSHLPYNVKKQ